VGRTKRLVTPGQRLAVIARDLRCVFPTCDRPERWCDVHHIISWLADGPTAIDNLVLLCRHHHTLVHEAGWSLTGTPSDLRFFRPDGSELGADPPPQKEVRTRVMAALPSKRHEFDFPAALERIQAIPYPRGP
jgi:hypothetical protein